MIAVGYHREEVHPGRAHFLLLVEMPELVAAF